MKKYHFEGVIFDLDGVITQTAKVHARSWKAMFDEFLKIYYEKKGEPFKPFSIDVDYTEFVDGKPRYEGVQSFLESRNIDLPFGETDDEPSHNTCCGLGNMKNIKFREIVQKKGAELYAPTIEFIKDLKAAGIKVGVASSSKNCEFILDSAGLKHLFGTIVDGNVSARLGLKGKPEGDIFLRAARNIGVDPSRSMVVEDATSGVSAGRNAGFGLVVGVARKNNADLLINNGADIVIRRLSEISVEQTERWFLQKPEPLASSWDRNNKILTLPPEDPHEKSKIIINPWIFRSARASLLNSRKPVFFLAYDGTLAPIVDNPDEATMSENMRDTLKKLSELYTVAIISGRTRSTIEKMVGIEGLIYAGSHGLDIAGDGMKMLHPEADQYISLMDDIHADLQSELGDIPGIFIKNKVYTVAVHTRLVPNESIKQIEDKIKNVVNNSEALKLISGNMVHEIMPFIEWDKGQAIRWIMKEKDYNWDESSVVYIGDDVTDHFAFRVIRTRGTGIIVCDGTKASAAHFRVSSTLDVRDLLETIIEHHSKS